MSLSINVLVIFVIFCIEKSYSIPVTTTTTERPYYDWDNLYKRNVTTSFMKIYAHEDKRYYIGTDFKATYIEAEMFCEEINMELVTVQSKEENDVLFKHIRDINRGNFFWTSGSKMLDGHHWVWMTKYEPVSYTNWNKGEPGNINEHCIALNHVKGNGLLWDDWDCNAKLYFVCEKDFSQPEANGNYRNNKNRETDLFHESSVSPNIALLHFEDKSYFVGRYYKATYLEALKLCTMINMHLVSINSEEENTRLHKYIRDTSAGDKFWSSGSRLIDGKSWIWMSNTQPIYYTNWGKNEPDNQNHFCIQLDNLKNDGLFWNDNDCSTKNHYICEKPRYVYQPATTPNSDLLIELGKTYQINSA